MTQIVRRALLAGLTLTAAPVLAGARSWRVPRTSAGFPDLQGTWSTSSATGMERPKDFTSLTVPVADFDAYIARKRAEPVSMEDDPVGNEDSEWWERGGPARVGSDLALTSWIVDPSDGKVPYREGRRDAIKAMQEGWDKKTDNPEDRDIGERCLFTSGGPPLISTGYNSNLQIVQTREHVAIHSEFMHDVRIVRIGGRHGPAAVTGWSGDSIGWWEDDTLVVETTNFDAVHLLRDADKVWLTPEGKVTERFTRTDTDEIRYEFLIDDPATYIQAWRGLMILKPAKGRIFEYACHEGNYGLANILSGAREVEKAGK